MGSKVMVSAACAIALAAASARATEPPAGYQKLSVTNTTERVAFCTLLFDGRGRTELAIRPGKTWYESFDPRRDLRLVCQRSKGLAFGPLKPGQTYRLVPAAGAKLDIAEGAAE